MQEKVVRLRADPRRAFGDDGDEMADAHVRGYILDMVHQLAGLAETYGEPLLGVTLDEIVRRFELPSLPGSQARTPGQVV